MKKTISILLLVAMLSVCLSPSVFAGPTGPSTVMKNSVQEVIEWIQTVDVENFQNGAYKKGIPSLREKGELLVPTYPQNEVEAGLIEIVHDDIAPDGYTVIGYVYYFDSVTVCIYIKEINPSNAHLLDEGLIDYYTAQYGVELNDEMLSETTIGPNGEESINYLSYGSAGTVRFVKDGFEVQLSVNSPESWDISYLNNLCLDIVPFTYEGNSPAPSPDVTTGTPETYTTRTEFHNAVVDAKEAYENGGDKTYHNIEDIVSYIDFKQAVKEVSLNEISVQSVYISLEYKDIAEEHQGSLILQWDRDAYGDDYDYIEDARTRLTTNPVEINYNGNIIIKEEIYQEGVNICNQYFWVENDCNVFLRIPDWLLNLYSEEVFFDIQKVNVTAGTPDTSWYIGHEEDETFIINTADQLAGLAQLVNAGNDFEGKTITLGDDIDLSEYGESFNDGKGWVSIGRVFSTNYETYTSTFNGIFDGDGHTITGLYINDPLVSYADYSKTIGLFGVVSGGAVRNLSVVDVDITGGIMATTGGIVSDLRDNSTLEKCCITGTVGYSEYTGDIEGTSPSETCASVGGIVGDIGSGSTVKNCYSTATVNGQWPVGGVASAIRAGGSIENCYATGDVTGLRYVGGIIGAIWSNGENGSEGNIINCVALNSSVKGNADTGRVVGFMNNDDNILTSNYAFSGIVDVNGVTTEWSNKTYDGLDGKDVTMEDALTAEFWTKADNWDTSSWNTNVWTIEDGHFPVFKRNTVEGPVTSLTVTSGGKTISPMKFLHSSTTWLNGSWVSGDSNYWVTTPFEDYCDELPSVTLADDISVSQNPGFGVTISKEEPNQQWEDDENFTFERLSELEPGTYYVRLRVWFPLEYVDEGNGYNAATYDYFFKLVVPSKKVENPIISPNSGTSFTSSQMITLTCETEGATIYYTTDRTTPTRNSNVYTEPFMIMDATTVKAVAVKENMDDSEIVTASFNKLIGNVGGGGGGGGTTSYTVKFETNGGSAIGDKKVDKGDKLTKPETPTKAGYTFAGWYSNQKLTQEYDFNKDVTGNITLYAKWTENENTPTPSPSTQPSQGWENPFSDVSTNDWFYSDVEYVCANNLFKGITETEFQPEASMTRGMLVTVLWRMQGSPVVENNIPFIDVPENAYYTEAVKWAERNGIVNGVSDDLFSPDTEITRQDIAVILLRYLDYVNADYVLTEEYRMFADENDIADYAKNAVQILNKLGILNGKGDNVIDPQGKATRAEVAAMLCRIQEVIN